MHANEPMQHVISRPFRVKMRALPQPPPDLNPANPPHDRLFHRLPAHRDALPALRFPNKPDRLSRSLSPALLRVNRQHTNILVINPTWEQSFASYYWGGDALD